MSSLNPLGHRREHAMILILFGLSSTLSTTCAKGVDVAIIGGGPCGFATALALQRASPNAGVS